MCARDFFHRNVPKNPRDGFEVEGFEFGSSVLNLAVLVHIHLREFFNGYRFRRRFGELSPKLWPGAIRNRFLNITPENVCSRLVSDTASEPASVWPSFRNGQMFTALGIFLPKDRHTYAPFFLVGNESGFSPTPFSFHSGIDSINRSRSSSRYTR